MQTPKAPTAQKHKDGTKQSTKRYKRTNIKNIA